MIRVLIADQIASIIGDWEKLAPFNDRIDVCGIARDPAAIVDEARRLQPDVLLIHEGFGGLDLSAIAAELAAVAPMTKLLTIEADLSASASGEELVETIERAAAPAEVQAAPADPLQPGMVALSEPPEAEVIHDVPHRRPRRPGRTRADLILVFSGKGGVGKSMIATNLAAALATDTGGRIALVDLNLQFGDVGVMLRIENHLTSIDDLSQQGEQVEPEFLDEVMATGAEGMRVLLAPSSPEFADLVTSGNLRAILRELGKAYDYIVVDSPAHLEERVLETIEVADQIVLVTGYNVTAVKDAKITLRLFEAMGVDRDKVVVVLNQTRPKVSFAPEEVEKILRCRMLAKLPYDARVDDAIDTGRPIVLTEPKADISKQFHAVVSYLAPEGEQPAVTEPARATSRSNRRRFSLGRH